MTRDSQKQSKGERYNAVAALRKLTFLQILLTSRQLILITVYIQDIHGSYLLSRIPVTDIAQPYRVNAMKVSERYPASLSFYFCFCYFFYLVSNQFISAY